jgi:hypothetical protein
MGKITCGGMTNLEPVWRPGIQDELEVQLISGRNEY